MASVPRPTQIVDTSARLPHQLLQTACALAFQFGGSSTGGATVSGEVPAHGSVCGW